MQYLIYLVPLTIGITELGKMSSLGSRYIPFLALVVALVLAFIFHGGYSQAMVFDGLVAGLSAMGVWSGIKKVKNG